MPELTDLSYVRALCEKYDFALSKGFGQNFIINPGLPIKIVDASRVDKRYGVIEIGPGIGVLTRELAKRAAKVVSIEVDERLPPLLAETMAGVDNFKLVMNDVLKVDLKALIAEEFPGMPVAVCANLPYYITSPDGRVFGKMGHSERSGEYLYKNVTGDKYQPIFEGGVDYFKI